MGANSSNEAGHWESTPIARLNDDILGAMNLEWSDWTSGNAAALKPERCTHFHNDILSTLAQDFPADRPAVVKDPRICRLMPLYRTAFDAEKIPASVIIPVRNPLAVMESLGVRNGMPKTQAGLLWLRHVCDAVQSSDGLPRAFLSFEALLEEPVSTLEPLIKALELETPYALSTVDDQIAEFLSNDLIHHQFSNTDVALDPLTGTLIKDAYAALLVLCKDLASKPALHCLSEIATRFSQANGILAAVSHSYEKCDAERLNKIAQLQSQDSAKADEIERLKKQIEGSEKRSKSALAETEIVRKQAEEELADSIALTKAQEESLRQLKAQIDHLNTECERSATELLEMSTEKTQVVEALQEATAEKARLADSLAEETARMTAALGRVHMLEGVITQALRKPWKPIGEHLRRRLAFAAAGLVKPFSERRSLRFRNSAHKRNPRRYLSGGKPVLRAAAGEVVDRRYDAQTQHILDRFPSAETGRERPFHMNLCSSDLVQTKLGSAPKCQKTLIDAVIGFSVITPYYAHKDFFVWCAASVQTALERTSHPGEWVIFNDDPSMADSTLFELVPVGLRDRTTIVSDGQNHGIAVGQNRAIAQARYPWLVLLDCDDMLEPHALETLERAIKTEPGTRYFSGLMIDIDDRGNTLRRRKRDHLPRDLFDAGMVVGHMVAIREDLFNHLGGFDPRFAGVQDYDFALKVAAREQVGLIADHVYRYRWHGKTQSLSSADKQEATTNAVRAAFLLETLGAKRPGPVTKTALSPTPHALCAVRTQGTRMDLLKQSLQSIWAQSVPMTPCIVVHGDDATTEFVKAQMVQDWAQNQSYPAVILQAPDLARKRGYPCNVALDFLSKNRQDYDLLCFLDDDDYYLPKFAERLVNLMRATGADLVYGSTNALSEYGEPAKQHRLLPFFGLLSYNFIPFNSFLVRTPSVLATRARFEEALHYLEDYDFLIQLLLAGIRAEALCETVSQYRLLGDGNTIAKHDFEHHEMCENHVKKRIKHAKKSGFGGPTDTAFLADLLFFPATAGINWGDREKAHLEAAYRVFSGGKRKATGK